MGRKRKACPRAGCDAADCLHCKCTAPDCDHEPGDCTRERVTCRSCKSNRDRTAKKRKMIKEVPAIIVPALIKEVPALPPLAAVSSVPQEGDEAFSPTSTSFCLTELVGEAPNALALAEIGDLDRLKALYQSGKSDFGTVNGDGDNVFMLAAANGHTHVLKWMAAFGIADYSSRDIQGRTAMVKPASSGHMEVVKWLVQQGVDPRQPTYAGCTPLLGAAFCGSVRMLEYLNQFSSFAEVGEFGQNALHYAAANGRMAAVRWLVEQPQVDRTAQNTDGFTARDLASRAGHREVVKFLASGSHATFDVLDVTDEKFNGSTQSIQPGLIAQ